MRLPVSALALSALVLVTGCDSGNGLEDFGPPRTARILKVSVDAAPLRQEDGDAWDPGGGEPDIYFRLFDDFVDYEADPQGARLSARVDDDIVRPVSSGDAWYENVRTADFSLVWDVDPGFVIRDLTDPLYLALFDYDPFDDDDPMAYSEDFTLLDFAPTRVDGTADVIVLDGFDRGGVDLGSDFRVRLTVQFDD